ncbi:hypothetical protein V1478_010326 [Vespula squamosa]|uniref:Uncharacterized protein n=1 Tax=Vespula squamosa TaxID=30214 RepID=A0ABD2AHR0_VESSQ
MMTPFIQMEIFDSITDCNELRDSMINTLIGVSLLPIIIVVVIADGELTSGTQHKISNINNKQYN